MEDNLSMSGVCRDDLYKDRSEGPSATELGSADSVVKLQYLPVDVLEQVLCLLKPREIAFLSRESHSLRLAGIAVMRSVLRQLLDRSAKELSELRNRALSMRAQSLAGRKYGSLALEITTVRTLRMELRVLASATWRYLCAPVGPALALPGSLFDHVESVLDSVAAGSLTRDAQPDAAASLFQKCETYLDFFSDTLEPTLAMISCEWAPFGSRITDTLATTFTRRLHSEAIIHNHRGLRLSATYRLPGLVDIPPHLPSKSSLKCLRERDSEAHTFAAHRLLSYVRRAVHMHNLVLVLKDQWAMEESMQRRGSTALLTGFIFDQHDQPGDCRLVRPSHTTDESAGTTSSAEEALPVTKIRRRPQAPRTRWDGLFCELEMFTPDVYLLPPHLQNLANQIWPQVSTDTFTLDPSKSSCKTIAPSRYSSSSTIGKVDKRSSSTTTGISTLYLNDRAKSARCTHSTMTMQGVRAESETADLQESLSFDNVDALKAVLYRFSHHENVGGLANSSSTHQGVGREIRRIGLSVKENSCVCFSLFEMEDIIDDNDEESDGDNHKKLKADPSTPNLQKDQVTGKNLIEIGENFKSPLPSDDGYCFRLQITARYPDPTKAGLRQAIIKVVESRDETFVWLEDDVSLV